MEDGPAMQLNELLIEGGAVPNKPVLHPNEELQGWRPLESRGISALPRSEVGPVDVETPLAPKPIHKKHIP
jgi:hypothetical protein